MILDYHDRFLFVGKDGKLYSAHLDDWAWQVAGPSWVVEEVHLEWWEGVYPPYED